MRSTRHRGRDAAGNADDTRRNNAGSDGARARRGGEAAAARGEVPVGAVLIDADGGIVAASGNRVERDRDPTAHAEMLVLRAGAAALGAKRLAGCDLYVTLEPCPMCAAAIALARIRRLYFARLRPEGRRRRARAAHLRAADLPSPAGGLRRHRRARAPARCCANFFGRGGRS